MKIKKYKPCTEMLYYSCKWCKSEKREDKYFKRSISNQTLICTECITQKYNELLKSHGKDKAIFICCHYLNIPYIFSIAKGLAIDGGIGQYIKLCNVKQYQDMDFADSITGLNLDFDFAEENAIKAEMVTKSIDNIINELNLIKYEIKL